jgi:hypothetical protein
MSTIKEWQDSYFKSVKRVEEPVLKFTGQMADSMERFVPERPHFMTDFPTMSEVVENQLKFRKRFVDEQAAFARKMIKAMGPVVVKLDAVAEHPEPRNLATARAARAKKAA